VRCESTLLTGKKFRYVDHEAAQDACEAPCAAFFSSKVVSGFGSRAAVDLLELALNSASLDAGAEKEVP
jgi:hypothetical protein